MAKGSTLKVAGDPERERGSGQLKIRKVDERERRKIRGGVERNAVWGGGGER